MIAVFDPRCALVILGLHFYHTCCLNAQNCSIPPMPISFIQCLDSAIIFDYIFIKSLISIMKPISSVLGLSIRLKYVVKL